MNEIKLLDHEIAILKTTTELSDGPVSCGLCPCLVIVLELTGKNYSKFFLICELKDNPYMSWRTLSLLLVQHEFTIRVA